MLRSPGRRKGGQGQVRRGESWRLGVQVKKVGGRWLQGPGTRRERGRSGCRARRVGGSEDGGLETGRAGEGHESHRTLAGQVLYHYNQE